MQLSEFLSPDRVLAGVKASGKKQILQFLTELAAEHTQLDAHDLMDTLLAREKLGSTGVGHGVAIPHGKNEALEELIGFFVLLERPVPFDAIDQEPVDLVFLLLAPTTAGAQHLKALATISRLMRDDNVVEKIRNATHADAIYALLTDPDITS
jgi:PTS system nitrogen regulatory IIA component